MHHFGGGHGDVEASGDDLPLRQGARKSFRTPPELGSTMAVMMELFMDGGSGL